MYMSMIHYELLNYMSPMSNGSDIYVIGSTKEISIRIIDKTKRVSYACTLVGDIIYEITMSN